MDNTRNGDGIGDKELLVVSFGTSCKENCYMTIGEIEQALEDAFGTEYAIRRSFTSRIIIDHIKRRDGVEIDNMTEALERAAANGVKTLVLQPTHLMDGLEYNDVVNDVEDYADSFEQVAIGKPLLSSGQDYQDVMAVLTEAMAEYDDGETAICLMGHGTEAESNVVYEKMQRLLAESDYRNYYVGTMKAAPTLEEVLTKVREGAYKRVVLRPLMIVAGVHVNSNMAGDGKDSWKSQFTAAGYEVVCVAEGLGGIPAIQGIFVRHAREAMELLWP